MDYRNDAALDFLASRRSHPPKLLKTPAPGRAEILRLLELAARAPQLLRRLEAAGVSMVFSGHLHVWSAANLLDHGHRRILQVQAGTALCARESDRQNEFAVLDIDGDEAVIHRHVAPMAQDDFDPPQTLRLSRAGGAWRLIEGSEPEPILPGATETAFSTA